jgi:hypothetical protein
MQGRRKKSRRSAFISASQGVVRSVFFLPKILVFHNIQKIKTGISRLKILLDFLHVHKIQ